MAEDITILLFITGPESLQLEAIAQKEPPHSQRAQALLAVDAGSTVEQAALVSGLTVSQVRFWIGRFRNSRLAVFPEVLREEVEDGAAKQKKGKGAKIKGAGPDTGKRKRAEKSDKSAKKEKKNKKKKKKKNRKKSKKSR